MILPSNYAWAQGQANVGADQLNTFVQGSAVAAQLRSFIGLSNMSVLVFGIEAINDGGGGNFYWNGSTTSADDNFNIIRPNGVIQGAWERLELAGESSEQYTPAFEFLGGTPPIGNETLGMHTFFSTVTMPANFGGGVGSALVNPTGAFVAQITRNGASVGTMSISTGGVFAFTSSGGSPVVFTAGENIVFTAPGSPDATLANFSWTIQGTLS
jgi:hypothetical protein